MKTFITALTIFALSLSGLTWNSHGQAPSSGANKQPIAEKTDAKANIETALADAKRENRRVLIIWGGNSCPKWCPHCTPLYECVRKTPKIRHTLISEYDVVRVDIDNIDQNMALAARYGVDLRKQSLPCLTVLDGDGKVVVNQAADLFLTVKDGKQSHDADKLLGFLKAHQPTPLVAEKLLAAALDKAVKTDRHVFVNFSAPYCGWCKILQRWLLQPEIAAIFDKDFVIIKIDAERAEGGMELYKRMNPTLKGGVPWLAFLDSKGKTIITSLGPKGNIGYPAYDYEIVHFINMLEASKRRITENDIAVIRKSLEAYER